MPIKRRGALRNYEKKGLIGGLGIDPWSKGEKEEEKRKEDSHLFDVV